MGNERGYNDKNTWEFNLEQQIRWNEEDAKDDLSFYVKEFLPQIINDELGISIEIITRIQFYRRHIQQYISELPPSDLLIKYFYDYDDDSSLPMQTFIIEHIKPEYPYLTGIGILDSIDSLYFATKENGLISKFK